MASRPTVQDNDNITASDKKPSTTTSMDLLGSSPSTPPARAAGGQPAQGDEASAPARASTRSSVPTPVRSPARVAEAPSRLPVSSSTTERKLAAAQPPNSSALPAEVTPPRQSDSASSPAVPNNTSAIPATPPTSSTVTCRTGADCPNRNCIAGVCQTSSGFALSISTTPSSAISASNTHGRGSGHKGKHGHGTPTACSDPRCTLPADITSMNGAEENDISASLGSSQRAVSSAATAGIVLAVLFAILALLLIVPKIRDWARRCLGLDDNTKDEDDIIYGQQNGHVGNNDDGSPEFGNAHASAFMDEKRGTTGYYSNDDHLPVYENNGQGDIADEKFDLKQEDYFRDYTGYYNNSVQQEAPVLPALYYDNTRDLASYVEHHPSQAQVQPQSQPQSRAYVAAPSPPYAKSASNNRPADLTPWISTGRDAGARETVLPYTVEEDRDVLQGLKNLGTPALNDSASTQ